MGGSKSSSSNTTQTTNQDNRVASTDGAIAAQTIDGGVVINHTAEGAFELASETVSGALALAGATAANSFGSVGPDGVVVSDGSGNVQSASGLGEGVLSKEMVLLLAGVAAAVVISRAVK